MIIIRNFSVYILFNRRVWCNGSTAVFNKVNVKSDNNEIYFMEPYIRNYISGHDDFGEG